MNDPFTAPRQERREKLPQQQKLETPVAPKDQPPQPEAKREQPAPLPLDFAYDAEHPVMPIPFKVQFGDYTIDGVELSVTAAYVSIGGALDPAWRGQKQIVKLQFDFGGFSVTLFPEVVIAGSRRDGEMTLQFMEPAGAHLPQLRYILNSYIAGDIVSMGGLMSYSGPTQPKAAKAGETKASKFRVRSVAVAFLSLSLIFFMASILFTRFTQSYEVRPVFLERTGNEMKATTAGQVSYLNPDAKAGEVVFSINANSGDVLNFQLPCDCEVAVTEGIFQGATVLPIDAILSFFEPNVEVRVQTQMSIEGLAKAMNGEQAYLDINDGRSIPVRVVVTSATSVAALRGDPFVPVKLVAKDGALTRDDIGKSALLRLSKSWLEASFLNPAEKP